MIHSNSDIFESGSVSEKCYQMLQVASWVHWWLAAFPGIPHTALAGASSGQRYVPWSLSSQELLSDQGIECIFCGACGYFVWSFYCLYKTVESLLISLEGRKMVDLPIFIFGESPLR